MAFLRKVISGPLETVNFMLMMCCSITSWLHQLGPKE
uniref:Uncharacterized protein n=1 Tax=Rhizophora mucronata TaxID=61149 RepID=A0A2P2NYA7_RHIMU